MTLRSALLVVMMVVATAGSALAQQSLGALGGPLDLAATPTPAAGPVIDQHAIGQTAPVGSDVTDPARLREAVAELQASAHELQDLVAQTEHSWEPFVDAAWLWQVHGARSDVNLAAEQLRPLRPSADFAAPVREARAACAELLELVQPLEDGLDAGHAPLLELVEPVRATVARIDGALADIDRRRRRLAQEAPPAPLTSGEVDEIAAAVCSARHGGDAVDRRLCHERQLRAATEIEGRFAFTVGLDDADFNAIRNACAAEFPADLAGRNLCEQSRMAAARQGRP